MDRIINVKVGGNYLIKDNKNAGVRGEANVTRLRITFDDGWIKEDYAKKVTFWDAKGLNPVAVVLTPTMAEDDRTYLVPIPQEPMTEAGKLTFVIEGEIEGKVQRSLSDTLEVKDSPIAPNAGQPVPPTPDKLTQLQGSLDEVKGDIMKAMQAKDGAELARDEAHMFNLEAGSFSESANLSALDALMYKNEAENAADRAESTIGKSSYIGANGNWFAWDDESGEFYDTGVKAQSGSTVYVGDNPPEDAAVWINPDGKITSFAPYIGENDNWFVFDMQQGKYVDTGVKAKAHTPQKGVDYFTEAEIVEILKPIRKEIASIESLHYYGDRDIVPNVEVTLRTVFDDEGWMIGDVVDIVQLDNYSIHTDTVILPGRCGGYFLFGKGKFLKRDGKDADGSKVTKVIVPRLDNDEDPDMSFVDKDTFSSFFPNLETVIVCDGATKGYVDEKIGDIDTALENIISIQNTLIGGESV